ncbi:hypothetical protein SDC49_05060 [Lactobacillus sp. R2/2]|nr:hypothetical protein [Lactobacillus sp. R2/2]
MNRFYKNYAKSRAAVSIKQQNWDLPEPPANKYSKKLINQAKEFSDTAVITLSRLAGEEQMIYRKICLKYHISKILKITKILIRVNIILNYLRLKKYGQFSLSSL